MSEIAESSYDLLARYVRVLEERCDGLNRDHGMLSEVVADQYRRIRSLEACVVKLVGDGREVNGRPFAEELLTKPLPAYRNGNGKAHA